MSELAGKNVRINLTIDKTLYEVSKIEAARRGMSVSAFLRFLILKELDRTQRF